MLPREVLIAYKILSQTVVMVSMVLCGVEELY